MENYVFVPYWLFVVGIGLAVLGLEHVGEGIYRGVRLVLRWRRRRSAAALPVERPSSIVLIDEYRREQSGGATDRR